jgi:hypothetical protein
MTAYPPRNEREIREGCTCPGRAEHRHDLACEHVLRGAGLLPPDTDMITPEAIIGAL